METKKLRPPDDDRDPEWVSTRRVAERTGTTVGYWRNRRYAGDGPPYVRISSNRCLYAWSEIRKYLDERTVKSTTDEYVRSVGR